MTHSGVDKSHAYVAVREASWVRTAQNGQSSKICCRFFRARFRCSGRRQYSGSLLRDTGIISLLIIGGGVPLSSRGQLRPDIYATDNTNNANYIDH